MDLQSIVGCSSIDSSREPRATTLHMYAWVKETSIVTQYRRFISKFGNAGSVRNVIPREHPLPPSKCLNAFRDNPAEVRMEECPPSGDDEDDPSKSDNPPAIWTTNPTGDREQAQGESERS